MQALCLSAGREPQPRRVPSLQWAVCCMAVGVLRTREWAGKRGQREKEASEGHLQSVITNLAASILVCLSSLGNVKHESRIQTSVIEPSVTRLH